MVNLRRISVLILRPALLLSPSAAIVLDDSPSVRWVNMDGSVSTSVAIGDSDIRRVVHK